MIIYRFERNGLGPYTSLCGALSTRRKTRTYYKYLNRHRSSREHSPKLKYFIHAHSDKRYMFGCSSKENLRIYFGGDFKGLFKEGFRIKRYKVPSTEVLDMGVEVAFPVKYHKLQTYKKVKEIQSNTY